MWIVRVQPANLHLTTKYRQNKHINWIAGKRSKRASGSKKTVIQKKAWARARLKHQSKRNKRG